MNQGTKLYYANGGETRKIDGSESLTDSNQNETTINSSDSEATTNSIPELEATTNATPESTGPVIFIDDSTEKTNATKSSTKKTKKSKRKKQKSNKKRINREILQTLLSRKKLYKILEHKLDMWVNFLNDLIDKSKNKNRNENNCVFYQGWAQWWRMLVKGDMWNGWTTVWGA